MLAFVATFFACKKENVYVLKEMKVSGFNTLAWPSEFTQVSPLYHYYRKEFEADWTDTLEYNGNVWPFDTVIIDSVQLLGYDTLKMSISLDTTLHPNITLYRDQWQVYNGPARKDGFHGTITFAYHLIKPTEEVRVNYKSTVRYWEKQE